MRRLRGFGVVSCKFGSNWGGSVADEKQKKKRSGNTEQHEGTRDHRGKPWEIWANIELQDMGKGV